MALINPIFGQMSGSVAGSTFAKNPAGQYVRQKVTPVNPNTVAQQRARSVFADATTIWKNGLTPAQATAWDEYAAVTSRTNVFGNSFNGNGQSWFIGTYGFAENAALVAGLSRTDPLVAPATPGLATSPSPQSCVGIAAGTPGVLTVTFANLSGDGVAGQFDPSDELSLIAVYYAGKPTGSRRFFKGPGRLIGAAIGDSGSPPTDMSVNLPVAAVADDTFQIALRYITPDNRLSPVISGTVVTV